MMRRHLLVAFVAVSMGCVFAMPADVGAAQMNFSLAVGESVVVGDYALQFSGLTAGGFPSYVLYSVDGRLLAHLPSPPPFASGDAYQYQNVSVATTGVTPDGAIVTGTFTVFQ